VLINNYAKRHVPIIIIF